MNYSSKYISYKITTSILVTTLTTARILVTTLTTTASILVTTFLILN